MVILGRMQDSWPSAEPEPRPAPSLPRVEDLPVVAEGYDPDRVRDAFDAFYRHLARLDATLRTIEAVEVFRDQAGELRKELRALRTAGWTQQPWLPSYSSREPTRPGLPDAVVRWAIEACFVIAVPVAASAADLRRLWIVLAAAAAVAIVAAVEWLASLERPLVPARAETAPAAPALEEPEPEPEPEPAPAPVEPPAGEATEWTLPPRAQEPEPAAEEPEPEEELTFVGTVAGEAEAEAESEPAEPAQEVELAGEPEDVPEEPPKRRAWFRRQRIDGGGDEADEEEQEEVPVVATAAEAEPDREEPAEEVASAGEREPIITEDSPKRRLWFRRGPSGTEDAHEDDEERPRHVRVLPADGESAGLAPALDPWEEELDREAEAEPDVTPRDAGAV